MTLNLGLAVALACAALTQLGFLCKHRGANHVPQIRFAKPLKSAKALFTAKWFLIGLTIGIAAWAHSTRILPHKGVSSLGLNTTVLPAARA